MNDDRIRKYLVSQDEGLARHCFVRLFIARVVH